MVKLPDCLMTQTRARATQIVRSDTIETAFRASGLDHAPNHLRTETVRCNPPRLVDRPKSWVGTYTGGSQPAIHSRFDPRWDGYGPHVAALANEVGDYPVLFSSLQMLQRCRACSSPVGASYPVLVHRLALLLNASFRPSVAGTPLRFANPAPPSGLVEDFHFQASGHAQYSLLRWHSCRRSSTVQQGPSLDPAG